MKTVNRVDWIVKGERTKRNCAYLLCVVALLYGSIAYAGVHFKAEQIHDVSIPSLNVADALNSLAQQTGATFLFPYDLAKSQQSNRVNGQYTLQQALDLLLEGTGLSGSLTDKNIVKISITGSKAYTKRGKTVKKPEIVRSNNKVSLFSGVAAFLAATFATPAATAQTSEKGFALEEVVVTARKREESLMDTPVSVSAFSGEDLSNRGIEQIDQVAESVPNVVFRTNANASANNNNAVVFIRGIGQDDFVPTVEPGVGIYVDNVYISQTSGALIDVADVESIQVLRGPQGTLFGKNTIGGAILINTVKPNEEFTGNVELSAGSRDYKQAKVSMNVPLTDNLYARTTYLGRHKDGYIDFPNISGDDGGGSDDTQAGRLALRWLPTDNLTIDFSGDYSRTETDGRPSVLGSTIIEDVPSTRSGQYNLLVAPANGLTPLYTNDLFFLPLKKYTSLGSRHERSHSDIWGTSLTISWELESMTVKSITNYREIESEDQRDGDHSPIDLIHIGGDRLEADQFSQEIQFSGTALEDRLQWLAGLYYFEEEAFNPNPVEFTSFGGVSGSKVDNSSMAAFSQGTYDLTDQLSLTVGLRYTKDEKESIIDDSIQYATRLLNRSTGLYSFFPPQTIKILPNQTLETEENEVDPYLNLSYRWNENLMTYLSYSEGFKGGGFVQRLTPGSSLTSFSPEFAKVYEVGFKWDGFDNTVRMTGAAFFTDYTDLQITVNRGIAAVKENAGDAEIKGFELEATVIPTERWQLNASLGYLDAKYTDLDPAATISKSNSLPSIAEWQVSASAAYTIPVPRLAGSIIARIDWSWTDDYELDANNTIGTQVEDYELINVALIYENDSEKWDLSLQGRNITDELYLAAPGNVQAIQGYLDLALAPPEEWSLKFRYRF